MRPYSPGGVLTALAPAPRGKPPDAQHTSFRAWTTRVSNPVCSPRFRASASEPGQRAAFATGVPANIYEFHLYTGYSTLLSRSPAWPSRVPFRGWAPGFHTRLTRPPTRPLRPVNPNNASTLRLTAAAGTELAGAYSSGTVIIVPEKKGFTTRRPSSPTRRRWIRVAPIVQDSPLLPPVGVWAVSQSQCGRSSSQTGYRLRPWWAVTPPTS